MSGAAIVTTLGGWSFIGEVDESDEEKVTLRNVATIRIWGTEHGIGELYKGPTKSTKLDRMPVPAGARPFRITRAAVVFEYEVDAAAWLGVLRG